MGEYMSGRPSLLTPELIDSICDELTIGKSMRQICEEEGFPDRRTVLRWLAENQDFASRCARAREMQADLMDDKILEAAESCDEENYQSTKVKISAYQWRASKLAPKKYGERIQAEHTGPDGGPLQIISSVPRPPKD
jgi:hypothetical protein